MDCVPVDRREGRIRFRSPGREEARGWGVGSTDFIWFTFGGAASASFTVV